MDNDRLKVIENIKIAIEEGNFNKKVEEGDPVLTVKQREEMISNFDNLKVRSS